MNPLASFFQRNRERRANRGLLHLDDHLLRDIGLTRSDVDRLTGGDPTFSTKFDRFRK